MLFRGFSWCGYDPASPPSLDPQRLSIDSDIRASPERAAASEIL